MPISTNNSILNSQLIYKGKKYYYMSVVFGFYRSVGKIDEKGNDFFFEGGVCVLEFLPELSGFFLGITSYACIVLLLCTA